VTIAIRPSCRAGTAALVVLILADGEADYFLQEGWTTRFLGEQINDQNMRRCKKNLFRKQSSNSKG
jgi:hypothetical protein